MRFVESIFIVMYSEEFFCDILQLVESKRCFRYFFLLRYTVISGSLSKCSYQVALYDTVVTD